MNSSRRLERTIEREHPFCVWFGYEFDGATPTPQLCDLVERTAQQYIDDGKLIVLDSRWKNHISVQLEDCVDPLASDYDGFNWSSRYGSNSRNVLTQCEDLAKYKHHNAASSRYNPHLALTKEKGRTVVDSIAAESDIRNIHIAYPAQIMPSEQRNEGAPSHIDGI